MLEAGGRCYARARLRRARSPPQLTLWEDRRGLLTWTTPETGPETHARYPIDFRPFWAAKKLGPLGGLGSAPGAPGKGRGQRAGKAQSPGEGRGLSLGAGLRP